jgi:tetrahydromethanopterin S-methyltransferase subunit F
MEREPASTDDLQAQIDALARRVMTNRSDIDALTSRADQADARADQIEANSQVDRDLIAELQRDGLLTMEHAAQLEEALKSSRVIGAAIGVVMASRGVSDAEAFAILKQASNDSNRKLRELAADLLASTTPTNNGPLPSS